MGKIVVCFFFFKIVFSCMEVIDKKVTDVSSIVFKLPWREIQYSKTKLDIQC